MKKTELLSPAGSFESLIGAINAGCDAVYLAGKDFGARAYADNFTNEELAEAVKVCHIFGKAIYVTVNTLVKESELPAINEYLKFLSDLKVDGVIVQDLGIVKLIYESYPELDIHLSTQLSIKSPGDIDLFKSFNVKRVVTARELSLDEIKRIKDKGIEVECFIHGAMCYCYSGQCLLSSFIGGRSGNRGRCSQPCRLPYHVLSDDKKTYLNDKEYILSMKDMYTLPMIPRLLDAGVDSLKIEGRMKKSVYVCAVTHVYRKYLDMYYSGNGYRIEKADEDLLKGLYLRSETSQGYYDIDRIKNSSDSMITLELPGYLGADESLVKKTEDEFLNKRPKLNADARTILRVNENATLELRYKDITCFVSGPQVLKAKNAPLSKERIIENIKKTGQSYINIEKNEIIMDDDIFLRIKDLNGLRRDAVEKLEDMILKRYDA